MKGLGISALATCLLASSAAFAGVHVVGGGYNGANTLPFWASAFYPQVRWQCLWRQHDIQEAGSVSKIEWLSYLFGGQGGTFKGCKILLCHTSLATLTAVYADNYAGNTPVTVFSGDYVHPRVPELFWNTIVEPKTTFNYNNSDNLLMEVSWTSWTGGGYNDYHVRNYGGYGGRVYASSATATSGTLNTDYSQYSRITITPDSGVTPTSLGRVKTLFR